MINYILADIKRICHKKSFLAVTGVYISAFCMMLFIYFNPTFTAEAYIAKTKSFLSFFPLFTGLSLFLSVFYDDFKSKSMQTAIGYGIQRYKIVAVKILESIPLLTGILFCFNLLAWTASYVLGLHLKQTQVCIIILYSMAELFRTIGYLCISAILVFQTQNAVNGTILYVLLSSRTILLLSSIILGQDIFINTIGDLTKYLFTPQLYRVCDTFLQKGTIDIAALIFSLSIYMVLPVIVSIGCFQKKELEF